MRVKKWDSLVLPLSATWLVLLPLAITFVGYGLSDAFGWQEAVQDRPVAGVSARHEAIGRSRMLTALIPFILISTLIALNLIREMFFLFGADARKRLLLPLGIFAAASAFIMVRQFTGGAPEHEIVLGKGFVQTMLAGVERTGAIGWAMEFTGETSPAIAMLRVLIGLFSIFLAIGAACAVAGTISCLAHPPRTAPTRRRRYYADLQRRRLDVYLYASALLLVSGLFFIDACMRWPAGLVADRDLYMDHVDALMLQNGVLYSTIIASYYVPAAAAIRFAAAGAAEPVAADPGDRPIPDATVADRAPASHIIKVFAAVLSPTIAGILTQLLEGVGL